MANRQAVADIQGTREKHAARKAGWILGGIAGSLAFVIAWWWARDPEVFIETKLGLGGERGVSVWAWLLMLSIVVGYAGYTARSVKPVREHLFTWSWLKVIGIAAAIGTGIVEEVVFRQLLMDWLMRLGAEIPLQIAASAVIFGLAHALWVMLSGDWRIVVPVVVATTVLGALLATLYIVADRSTLPSITAHVLINVIIEPWLILGAIAGTWNSNDD